MSGPARVELYEEVVRRRTGVIVGVAQVISAQQADEMTKLLAQRFPHVTFAIVDNGASSVAFEWDEPEVES